MSSALKGSSAIRHFECGNTIEIRDGIIFDLYTGLPHRQFGCQRSKNVQHFQHYIRILCCHGNENRTYSHDMTYARWLSFIVWGSVALQ